MNFANHQKTRTMAIKILNIQSSASMDWSLTRKLSNAFLENISKQHKEVEIETLDLVKTPPPYVSPEWISGAFSKTQLTQLEVSALSNSDEYIAQVEKASIILIGAPMYNYGMPASLKAWFDQIARINKTFSFDLSRGDFPIEPILRDKVLVLMTSSGEFGFEKGGIREDSGHLVPHVQACAHYLGVNAKTDFYHVGIEYQEFKDQRHEASKQQAFESIPALVETILNKYFPVSLNQESN
ncbi:FMN-dependent NADH-azoreductase [Algoriphagus marincola]|uniref:FMN-dependent NADH-azoreductase n=1 Tax=Algoriphagus marincola TaxID=264027 RepID=UPI0004237849|nr:NAD(P)H-dependent oxidoreductase [Algoriphagus marincola]